MAPGGVHEDVPPGRFNVNPDEINAALCPFFGAVPDAQWRQDHRMVAGNAVVVRYTLTGHLVKDIGPFTGRGQTISSPGMFVLTFVDGLLMSARDYWDPVEFAAQAA